MNIIKVTLLSVIQGITEFIPVSSSGHLVIIRDILKFDVSSPVLFVLFLHIGTIMSVIIFFNERIFMLVKKTLAMEKVAISFLFNILIALLATGVIGLLLKKFVESHFEDVVFVGGMLFINGAILFLSHIATTRGKKLDSATAAAVGFAQGIAVIPGISRAGSTITMGCIMGLSKEDAFDFSFLLSIPAVIGAMTFEVKDVTLLGGGELLYCIYGMIISGISGYISLKLLKKVLMKNLFKIFAIYCIIIGMIILLL